MNRKIALPFAGAALLFTSASSALAADYYTEPAEGAGRVPAPREAFELGIDVGYAKGFGEIARGERLADTLGNGMGFGLLLGYRALPEISVQWVGRYEGFKGEGSLPADTRVHGITTSAEVTAHGNPYKTVDPTFTLGMGYRLLLTAPPGPNNDVLVHGFELGKVEVGLDLRAAPSVAIAPMIGADVNMYVWRKPENGSAAQIPDKRLSSYLYAGIRGRFDLAGYRERYPIVEPAP